MKFYDLKTRTYVEVADKDLTKKKMESKTKTGAVQVRYAVTGKHDGRILYKFVSEKDYKASAAKEE